MITDEQIEACKIAANESYKRFKNSVRGQIVMPQDDWEWHFAQAVFKMAQEVRPLVWARLDHFDTWIAPGIDYDYIIPIAGDFYHLHYGDELPCSSNSIDELKKAAQADFNRRVLENLTHGVTDET